jgi:hypothetical protein
MDWKPALEHEWSVLRSFFGADVELERSAREFGALRRKRRISSASDLLRLILAYGSCGLSLRQTAAWAAESEVAEVSDVAVLKRLRGAADWVGHLLACMLAERAETPSGAPQSRLRLVDATSISCPGSRGTDWRIHCGFDLARLCIDGVELTDEKTGENLGRVRLEAGDIVVADRGYARWSGLLAARQANAHFIVRTGWSALALTHRDGTQVDLIGLLRGLPDAQAGDFDVLVQGNRRRGEAIPVRLIAVRKSEPAAAASRKDVLNRAARKMQEIDLRTIEAASYVIVVTSLPRLTYSGENVLEIYRFRWQIELAFKRMKSLLQLGDLPSHDPPLARTFLLAKLLAAVVIDNYTERFLSFSPWGYRLVDTPALGLANSDPTA